MAILTAISKPYTVSYILFEENNLDAVLEFIELPRKAVWVHADKTYSEYNMRTEGDTLGVVIISNSTASLVTVGSYIVKTDDADYKLLTPEAFDAKYVQEVVKEPTADKSDDAVETTASKPATKSKPAAKK